MSKKGITITSVPTVEDLNFDILKLVDDLGRVRTFNNAYQRGPLASDYKKIYELVNKARDIRDRINKIQD